MFKNWIVAVAMGAFLLSVNPATSRAQGDSNGYGKDHNKHDNDGDDDQAGHYYRHHEQDAARGWYYENAKHLPPGLAKKDQLPPGLEKQLVRRGSLPPGLQKRIQPCPQELERRLPPPPADCVNVLIGGHVVLLNRKTNIVVDIFHFEVTYMAADNLAYPNH